MYRRGEYDLREPDGKYDLDQKRNPEKVMWLGGGTTVTIKGGYDTTEKLRKLYTEGPPFQTVGGTNVASTSGASNVKQLRGGGYN
jgi:hypothetical protein